MAEKRNRNKNVDEAGIRLAPTPVHDESYCVMPSVRQEFVISPQLKIDVPEGDRDKVDVSTEDDFQPRKKDVSKRWKRRRRATNVTLGAIMLAFSIVALLPYILGACNVFPKAAGFIFVPQKLGALKNLIDAFRLSVANNFKGAAVKQCWANCVPDIMLTVGVLAVFVNMIKSVLGVFGAIKPKNYFLPALIYLLMALGVLIVYLVGAPSIGVERIDFVKDFIKGYATSELFGITIFALGYFLASAVCSALATEKYGYLK